MPIFLFDKVEMTHRSLCRDVQNWNYGCNNAVIVDICALSFVCQFCFDSLWVVLLDDVVG